jgi:exopolysaccharide biosynthesis polyprenyl glycosylphosphotransferase
MSLKFPSVKNSEVLHEDSGIQPRNAPFRSTGFLLHFVDTSVIASSIFAGFLLRWSFPRDLNSADLRRVVLALVFGLMWKIALSLNGAYESKILGNGYREFEKVTRATIWVFSSISILSFSFKNETSRGFVLISMLIGYLGIVVARQAARKWLRRQWANGTQSKRTVVIQGPQEPFSDASLQSLLQLSGYKIARVFTTESSDLSEVEIENWVSEVVNDINLNSIDAVIVAEFENCRSAIQKLSWRLETPRVEMLVALESAEVFGPRISVNKVANLPLLLIEEPRLIGPKKLVKRLMDLSFGLTLLLILSPILLMAAIGVKLTSRGPVIYSQERVGLGGKTISVYKLRTMIQGANKMRDQVIGKPNAGGFDQYLRDPRITKFGKFLRRWSIDEVPQLFNVIIGNMSLVGPRPMLLQDFSLLVEQEHRRHITNPGLTGLWQVSGRKLIDWEGGLRMDLDYVENWSPSLDIVIIFRTIKVVLTGHGAY